MKHHLKKYGSPYARGYEHHPKEVERRQKLQVDTMVHAVSITFNALDAVMQLPKPPVCNVNQAGYPPRTYSVVAVAKKPSGDHDSAPTVIRSRHE